ncbi:13689_t:CDS:2, partial [Entrophospora sp. SA101]
HLKSDAISRVLPLGEAISGGGEGSSLISSAIVEPLDLLKKNIANSDVISAVDKPKLNFSKFLKRRNNMDQTERIDAHQSSDIINKANDEAKPQIPDSLRSTNMKSSTSEDSHADNSQIVETKDFSEDTISKTDFIGNDQSHTIKTEMAEILPVGIIPIVGSNLFSPKFMYAMFALLIIAVMKKMQSKLFELADFLDPILQYLVNDKALYPTLYVNRFWYCIAGQILWKHIELGYTRQAKFIEICTNLKPFHGPSVRNLICSYCDSLSDNKINGIIQSCPNIVYLNFNAIGRLAISDTAIINIAHAYPNLLRLDLFECGYISDTAIRAIARSCHNLQHLNLGLFRFISESTQTCACQEVILTSEEEQQLIDKVLLQPGGIDTHSAISEHLIKTNVLSDFHQGYHLRNRKLDFTSPLVRAAYLQERLGSRTHVHTLPNSFEDFIKKRVWQMEFYHAARQLLPKDVHISPDVGAVFASEGWVDFYVDDEHDWMI